ncbi:chemotaxis protein CheW [Breoghania sp.]|uniref:chemotaxis protein CheW n=1 Tax=Breoghania sp. TaxID=2065378 RepID=UPI002614DAE6|nr:chemotaxis protein CheW [Breoghania sp.]MDJ0933048.1 chemotaxis protein CheW [Breoghania sp.]
MAETTAKPDQSVRETRQFISFRVDREEFTIDIISVREIKGWTETATLPNQPQYNRGVMNLRGTSCRSSICAAASAWA